MVNFQEGVKEQVYKLASIGLCPNLVGQIVVDVMVNPPKQGEESYELCILHRLSTFPSLLFVV